MATKVVTGEVRLSYVNLFERTKKDDGTDGPYQVSLLIPKTDTATIDAIKSAVKESMEAGKASKFGGKLVGVKNPLRDGDEEKPDDENYKGMMFMNASSYNNKPVVLVDKQPVPSATREQIAEAKELVYSGCYGRASVDFYAYAKPQSKGIACGLNAVQKTRDGERLGGGAVGAVDAYADFGIQPPVSEFD